MSIARIAVAIALLACLPLDGCRHGAAVESAAASFAGTYAGTLPCADCPGIDATLAFAPDGSYIETMNYRERSVVNTTRGHWSLDASGKRVKLHADEANASDAWMEIVSSDEIRMLDADGNPVDSPFDYSLHRK